MLLHGKPKEGGGELLIVGGDDLIRSEALLVQDEVDPEERGDRTRCPGVAPLIPHPLRQPPPSGIHQLYPQRHLASRVGGAGEAGIKTADTGLHPVE